MDNPFDPFEFQLNLGGNTQTNQKRLISVIITPQTNVQSVAQDICIKYNIGSSLIDVIAETIYGQIENQIIEKQKKRSLSKKRSPGRVSPQKDKSPYEKKGSSPLQKIRQAQYANNKTKKFKNRFCSYLKQSPAKPAPKKSHNNSLLKQSNTTIKTNDVQTFRNSQHFINPSTINPSDEEYSFRPSCIETMDLSNNSFQNSLEITQPTVISMSRCSYSTNYTSKNDKKTQISHEKLLKTKNERTVFDNLYQHSILLNMKKEIDRKKSFEKLTFKPQMNPTSKKIIEKKILNNPEMGKSQKAIYLKTKIDPLIMSQSKVNQKSELKLDKSLSGSKWGRKQNRTPEKLALKKTQKSMSIYERGMLFRKKSQDKLSKMKKIQFYDEIKSCSFQPTFFSRKSVSKSRLL